MIIREIEVSDISAVKAINEKNLPENYSLEFYHHFITTNSSTCYVAEIKGKAVGYVLSKFCYEKEFTFCQISSICVEKEYRNLGIGSSLMVAVIDSIKKQKLSLSEKSNKLIISLSVRVSNTNAIQFYKNKMGFKISKILHKYYFEGEDAYEMVLEKEI